MNQDFVHSAQNRGSSDIVFYRWCQHSQTNTVNKGQSTESHIVLIQKTNVHTANKNIRKTSKRESSPWNIKNIHVYCGKYIKCKERHLSMDNNCIHTQCVKSVKLTISTKLSLYLVLIFVQSNWMLNPCTQSEYGKIRTLHAATGLGY